VPHPYRADRLITNVLTPTVGEMTGKVFIASLGFDATHVLRLIVERGLSSGDTVCLVTSSSQHPRAESAVKSVMDFVEKTNPRVEVKVLRLDEAKFEENVALLARYISESLKRGEVFVDISGGPKGLVLALYVASAIAGAGDVSLTLETTGERVKVPVLPNPFAGVTEKQLQVLRNLPSTVTALSSKMGVSKAAVSKLLQRLREKGLVVERAGRYEVSPAGRLLLGALG